MYAQTLPSPDAGRARRLRIPFAQRGKKVRKAFLPGRLARKLSQYAGKQKITSGAIFRTKSGKPLSRGQIWREMKALAAMAGVAATKVFPHNPRHLFATVFYRVCRDIAKLADILGHSSINTTRI